MNVKLQTSSGAKVLIIIKMTPSHNTRQRERKYNSKPQTDERRKSCTKNKNEKKLKTTKR